MLGVASAGRKYVISIDRQSMMQGFSKDSEGGFDRNSMKDMLANQESLTLEELKTYAQADSVKDFYYTGTTTVNRINERCRTL